MKLYNTLSRKTEDFKPQRGNEVTLYTCGPTVYNYYHIGNLRNAVFNDTLRRVLEASGYSVKHVMNITDVGHLASDADEGEDKLETGAKREGKTVWEVAEHYTEAFKRDMSAMNVLPPNGYKSPKYKDNYARATEFIDQQIEMVGLLIDKGFAYQTSQAIYFDVTKLPDYGLLSGQRLADKEVGARNDVVTDPDKKNPHDFAVWFFTVGHFKDHSMQWDSPWGKGFPGWHLECSAIIHATLGDPIDIHTGGVDHIGTHHPNEMAQTEAAYGHALASYWIHNEFILVDGTKMSKSKGNSYTLKDITDKGFDPIAYRLLVLQAHYRSELNFSWDNLEAAQNRLKNWQSICDLIWQTDQATSSDHLKDEYRKAVLEALQDNLDTPKAIVLIEEALSEIEVGHFCKDCIENLVKLIDNYLGIDLLLGKSDITDAQKTLIAARQKARAAKDWAKSDQLRDELAGQGIAVRDTDQGPVWSRI